MSDAAKDCRRINDSCELFAVGCTAVGCVDATVCVVVNRCFFPAGFSRELCALFRS